MRKSWQGNGKEVGSEGFEPYSPPAAINMGAFPVGRVGEDAGAELIEGWLCGFRAAPLQLLLQCLLLGGLAHLYTLISLTVKSGPMYCAHMLET